MAFTSALRTLSLGYVTFVLRANARKNSFGVIRMEPFLKKNYPILVLLFLLLTSGESQLQSCNLFLIITIQQSNRDVMAAQSEKIDIP